MRVKEGLFIAVCGIILSAGAANAQVIVRGGPPPALVIERPGPPLHRGWVWILPMDRETVCLGGWTLGEPTPASRGVDSWTMGSSGRGVCVDQRILALGGVRAEDLSEGP
jgi:hypothetical protein